MDEEIQRKINLIEQSIVTSLDEVAIRVAAGSNLTLPSPAESVPGTSIRALYTGIPDLADPRANGIAIAHIVWLWSLVEGLGL